MNTAALAHIINRNRKHLDVTLMWDKIGTQMCMPCSLSEVRPLSFPKPSCATCESESLSKSKSSMSLEKSPWAHLWKKMIQTLSTLNSVSSYPITSHEWENTKKVLGKITTDGDQGSSKAFVTRQERSITSPNFLHRVKESSCQREILEYYTSPSSRLSKYKDRF